MNISQTLRGAGLGLSSATHTSTRKRSFAGGLIFLSVHHLDNCAFGGPDMKTLYITEALSGDVLMAKMPSRGN